jgi:predicted phage terminase large subunit-like protein
MEEINRDADAVRARCVTLPGFIREAWSILEPVQQYVPNWHIEAVCEHLEAISRRQIHHCLFNIPPGTMKSLMVSVMWHAWEWGPFGRPDLRYLATAFNDGPVKRDTRKARDLILSEWYQSLWPIEMTRTGETSFANVKTGNREGVAFTSLTSQRGNRLLIDDPHSVNSAESETERESTTRLFRESALNRLNDQQADSIVLMMQRLHVQDMTGVIEELGLDFVKVVLPMEFEPERRCETRIGFRDPRQAEGELLDPVRFPRPAIDALKKGMTAYAYDGQYQQRPVPREGGTFKRHWFEFVPAPPAYRKICRGWDLAATKSNKSAWTAGTRMSVYNGVFYIENVVRDRETPGGVNRMIKSTATMDGYNVRVSIPQDPGQASKGQILSFAKLLLGHDVRFSPESGDKVQRARPLSAQAEVGNVKIVRTGDPQRDAWIEPFLEEITMFPGSLYKDQTDSATRAFAELLEMIKIPEPDLGGGPIQVSAPSAELAL